MKTKTLLIAAVMFLGISVAAFAQAQFDVSSSPVAKVVRKGYAEKVGEIGFNTIDASNFTVTGTITVDYKVAVEPHSVISVVQFADPDDTGTNLPMIDWEVDANTVVLKITPAAVDPIRMYSFRLVGVRINANDLESKLEATILSTGNLLTRGEQDITVLLGKDKPFEYLTNDTATLSILDGGSGTVTLTAREQFRSAMAIFNDPTQLNNQQIKIRLTDSIPAGITLTFAATDTSGHWTRVGTGVLNSFTSGLPTVFYTLSGGTDISEIEDFSVSVEVDAERPETEVYDPALELFAQITLAPLHVPFVDTSSIPRYGEDWETSLTSLYAFESEFDNTVLMIPYVTTAAGYDSGLAIANTTSDPGSDVLGFGGALKQNGKISFYFFPNGADPFMVDTTMTGVPDYPLMAGGLLPTGQSYILLLSQLVAVAKANEDFAADSEFSGYVIVVCDFTNAHGQYFISDFDNGDFDNGALMLVMDPGRRHSRMRSLPETFSF